MSVPGLTIIGESINDSVPSTHVLFEENNLEGIVDLARQQAAKGAAYIDVNVGPRSPGFMADSRSKDPGAHCRLRSRSIPLTRPSRLRRWKCTTPNVPGIGRRS